MVVVSGGEEYTMLSVHFIAKMKEKEEILLSDPKFLPSLTVFILKCSADDDVLLLC